MRKTEDVHILIHATDLETINKYIQRFNLDRKQLAKLNKFRKLANRDII